MNEILDRACSLYLDWCTNRIQRALRDEDADAAELLKIGASLAEFQKHRIAREKIAAARDIARRRAETAANANHPDPRKKSYDPRAPYGRKVDGKPITHDEFTILFDEHLHDTYGVRLPPDLSPTEETRRALNNLAREIPVSDSVAPTDERRSPAVQNPDIPGQSADRNHRNPDALAPTAERHSHDHRNLNDPASQPSPD